MYEKELKAAKKAAKKAGQAVMKIYNSDFEVNYKAGNSPVTRADLASESIILDYLKEFNYGILSEETKQENGRLNKEKTWIIDPLDGTSDFVDRTGDFSILIALVENGKPILGVVFCPAKKTIYYASAKMGAYSESPGRDKEKLRVSDKNDFSKIIQLTSRHHLGPTEINLARKLGVKNIKPLGSAEKICLIAAGEAELNINSSDKTWEYDICAADIILTEAGGRITGMSGNEFAYNKKDPRNLNGYVATNGVIHEKIIKSLAEF